MLLGLILLLGVLSFQLTYEVLAIFQDPEDYRCRPDIIKYRTQKRVEKRMAYRPVPGQPTSLQHLLSIFDKLESPLPFINGTMPGIALKQLPLCLVVQTGRVDQIKPSIEAQQYSNYKIVSVPADASEFSNYQQKLATECEVQGYEVYVPVDSPLKQGALKRINQAFQKNNIYALMETRIGEYFVTFDLSGWKKRQVNIQELPSIMRKLEENTPIKASIRIVALYSRVFQILTLLSPSQVQIKNDELPLYILELCAYHLKLVVHSDLFETGDLTSSSSLIKLAINQSRADALIGREQLQALQSLDQSHQINETYINHMFYEMLSEQNPESVAILHKNKIKQFTIYDVLAAHEDEQIIYLPEGHWLREREKSQFEEHLRRKGLLNAQSLKMLEKETRFCITVMSWNNEQHNRYIKVMRSVLHQNYSNYHVVFIDDFSDDRTLELTKKMLRKWNFNKVTFVRNLRHMYGTYNIVNAAHSFCAADEVQVLLDGDDEFIGTHSLKYLHVEYAINNAWIAYSMYKADNYLYGYGEEFRHMTMIKQSFDITRGRAILHMMCPIRTWRVSLLRQVPLSHHRLPNGTWFQVGYDNAIQLPLFELAGTEHVRMVKKILYLAHVNYGFNDGDLPIKVAQRNATYTYVVKLESLPQLASLDKHSLSQEQMRANLNELKQDEGKIYKIIPK